MVYLETPSRGPYDCHRLCFLAFAYLDGRRGLTSSYSSSSQGHCSALSPSSSTVLSWPDSQKCFNSCLATMKEKVSPSQMCTIYSGRRDASPCACTAQASGPLPTRDWLLLAPTPVTGQDGHFSESTSENTQLRSCAFCLGKNGNQRSRISPQALGY